MNFEIGDWVYVNPKYYKTIDPIRGIITAELYNGEEGSYTIYWEDGKKGNTRLFNKYILKV